MTPRNSLVKLSASSEGPVRGKDYKLVTWTFYDRKYATDGFHFKKELWGSDKFAEDNHFHPWDLCCSFLKCGVFVQNFSKTDLVIAEVIFALHKLLELLVKNSDKQVKKKQNKIFKDVIS